MSHPREMRASPRDKGWAKKGAESELKVIIHRVSLRKAKGWLNWETFASATMFSSLARP